MVFLSKTEKDRNTKGSNHLTLIERQKIQEMPGDNENCKSIAIILAKDEITVSREIKKRRNKQENRRYGLYGKKTLQKIEKESILLLLLAML